MAKLRESVGLRQYAQTNPLIEYSNEGKRMYEKMIITIENKITRITNKGKIHMEVKRESVLKNTFANTDKDKVQKKEPVKAALKIGRNELCYCGSGKKYKNCHGK